MRFVRWISLSLVCALTACQTLPEPKYERFEFPKEVFIGLPKRAYEKVAIVKAKVTYGTLTDKHDEADLCKNYFKKAAKQLLKLAQEKGADAVVDLKSVVYLMDGKTAMYPRAECFDDGSEGQVLAQGVAVKWAEELKSSH